MCRKRFLNLHKHCARGGIAGVEYDRNTQWDKGEISQNYTHNTYKNTLVSC